ncbi:hypothetical protein, partial [Plantactinospora alkalitolerans]|uniref:hypothetical protein n=1 Tax=Plantactinospora alkalitolerans TaxID=2789879 RepID=UPI001E299CE6
NPRHEPERRGPISASETTHQHPTPQVNALPTVAPRAGDQTQVKWPIKSDLDTPQLDLIIGEARRQLDRQRLDLESLRTRSNALLALCLVEIGLLSAGVSKVFKHSWLIFPWAVSVLAVLLALGGAIALLAARADLGGVNLIGLATADPPLHRVAAKTYATSVGTGDVTIAARITVFRDAVFLAIIGAILYAVVWPTVAFQISTLQPSKPTVSEVPTCSTCTPSLQPPPTTAPTKTTNVPNPPPGLPSR